MTPLEKFLAALTALGHGAKHSGSGWMARCPAHEDGTPSLRVSEAPDGRVLFHCHAGCTQDAVRAAIGVQWADLSPESQNGSAGAMGGVGGSSARRASATTQQASAPAGLTIATYAAAKQLPLAFLRGLGLGDVTYLSRPAVRVPYYGLTQGETSATRYRLAMAGEDKFRWKKGSKAVPYGMWRLEEARRGRTMTLVEGESDCHTLWHHGVPALGLPGASTWREERDAQLLEGIETIYVAIEPDSGGEAVLAWLARSAIRDRVRLLLDLGAKDASALHCADPGAFLERWKAAVASAVPFADHAAKLRTRRRRELAAGCSELAGSPRILELFVAVLARLGLVGVSRAASILFLALVSRVFSRPVSVAVKGPSSAGKSYLVDGVRAFFPESATIVRSAFSERALVYSEEDLCHRFLVLYEAAGMAGEIASYLVRTLLSEGCLKYETVEKTPEGLRARLIERPGPTGLIVTTTAASLHPENETRLLSITLSDAPEQTRAVVRALASGDRPRADLTAWQALTEWAALGPVAVFIPYAAVLAELVDTGAVRMRRDFRLLLTLIEAHALLHQATRARTSDGRVVATIEDYEIVRELVGDLVAEGVGRTASKTLRETVAAVASLLPQSPDGVSQAALARHLDLDRSSVSRRVEVAMDGGYLLNKETRRRAYKLVLGEPLPEDRPTLPVAADVARACCDVAGAVAKGPPPPPTPDPVAARVRAAVLAVPGRTTVSLLDLGIGSEAAVRSALFDLVGAGVVELFRDSDDAERVRPGADATESGEGPTHREAGGPGSAPQAPQL